MFKKALLLSLIISINVCAQEKQPDATAVMARKQIPVLCYHQIRDWRTKDRQRDKAYIMPPASFCAHMKMLADSGYHTILPDELYDHLTKGTELPAKPIMLTFDDTDGDQYTIARPKLMKYGFKGVFFITFNNIAKNKYYMSRPQVRQLADEGHAIECHTLTHPNVKKLTDADWINEALIPKQKLEKLTGKPVNYFAFPYGLWNSACLPQLHHTGFLAAFQLDDPRDHQDPLMTIRRVIDSGTWDTATLDRNIKHDFGRVTRLANASPPNKGVNSAK